jgi:hypothetical protein
MQIDLFCQVIDNYGDIGVCWRLARQLVAEHGCEVRLSVDDLGAFRVIAAEIDPGMAWQTLLGVEVVKWSAADALVPFEVVIEAFACNPPARYVEAMAAHSSKPVWINLEYLSAEAWVDDVHGMPSQHQRLPLTKYFFCPGFTQASGGLLREIAVAAGNSFPASKEEPVRIFAFAYPHAPVRALTQAFATAGVATTVTLAAPISQSSPDWQTATPVPQTLFDALLAQFDVLIVRGEDSFVRAQWAAKPFLWHIYPTQDGAHLVKLDAWLDRYCVGLDARVSAAYRAASHAFNSTTSDGTQSAAYELLAQNLCALAAHAVRWCDSLLQQTDLATRLVNFVATHKAKNLG